MKSNDPITPRVWNTPEKEGMLRFLDINNLKIARAKKRNKKVLNATISAYDSVTQYAGEAADSVKRKAVPAIVAGGLVYGGIKGCSTGCDSLTSTAANVQNNPQKAIASAMMQAEEKPLFDEIVNRYAAKTENTIEAKLSASLEQLGLKHKRELTIDSYVANNHQKLLGNHDVLVGVFRDFNNTARYANVINKVIDELDATYGKNHGITYNLLTALIAVESGGKLDAGNKKNGCSEKEACGLMQITAITAKELKLKIGAHGDHLTDERMKPYESIKAGAEYLITLKKRFNGSTEKALMAYNWGPTKLSDLIKEKKTDDPNTLMKHLNNETKNYVVKILSRIDILNEIENNKHGDYRLKKAEDSAIKYKKAA